MSNGDETSTNHNNPNWPFDKAEAILDFLKTLTWELYRLDLHTNHVSELMPLPVSPISIIPGA